MKLDRTLYHDIQLKNIQMIGINCYLNEKIDTGKKINTPLPLHIELKNESTVISSTRGISYLKVKVQFENKDNELFYIEVNYRGLCEAIRPIEEKNMKFYLKIQSVPMLWAYARETINNVMLKMGLPPIVLPALNINKMMDIMNEERKNVEE
ncbi:preprotein translocase subunit SecB [Clostridium algifaecis]|uniref:Preprotein translocase subunit SecB n=1 Tax=Clostridium algifaecis TaxID=1472040 RepID=A0ABS4KTD1_9CLOT|nr:protein-export chaperone SecB [Clostridium algifaecis]MBP2032696.1 preprotein translocase subunit SecB [Clostridium algifaecis]